VLLLAAVVLVASACKDTKTETHFDPSTCQLTCGEQRCVDIKSDPSHCGTDPATACDHVCAPGNICRDGVCGHADVAPYIRSVSPSSGAKDAVVPLTISGDRLLADLTLRLTTSANPGTLPCPSAATNPCPTPTSCRAPWCRWNPGALSVVLDLTGAAPAQPWTLRVVNPDGVISNAVPFGIVVPTPSLAGVVPSTVATGTKVTLEVSGTAQPGTGFTTGSTCVINGTGIAPPGQPLQSTLQGGQLDCALDATILPAGIYSLTVTSETGVVSNALQVTVSPSAPVITSVNPLSGTAPLNFLISGARFDPQTSVVLFNNVPIDASYVTASDSTISVRNFPTSLSNGPYPVVVRTGLGTSQSPYRTSNAVVFSIGTATVAITSFQPSTAYQGDPSLILTFTGSNLPSNTTVEIESPSSSTFVALPPPKISCTGSPPSATCTVSVQKSMVQSPGVPEPEGQWQARVRYGTQPTDPASSAWPLRVLSNQAILRDYSNVPDPQQAGMVGSAKTSLTFQVSNIRGPDFKSVRVLFMDPTGATTLQTLTPNLPDATTTALIVPGTSANPALPLTGLDTGTYLFKVWNPNSTPSNPLPFAVSPGYPSLATVCIPYDAQHPCAGVIQNSCCTTASRGTATSLTVTLKGGNFAKPDASGNGSTVMVAASFSTNWPAPDPCNVITTTGTQFRPLVGTATVNDPTQITVTFDPLSAYIDPSFGTTYYVGVWNPGLSGTQKSDCGVPVNATNLPWFKLLP
jgi:hypothetical protein